MVVSSSGLELEEERLVVKTLMVVFRKLSSAVVVVLVLVVRLGVRLVLEMGSSRGGWK